MSGSILGSISIVMLLSSALLSTLPSEPFAALIFGLGALWLEGGGVNLGPDRSRRFSPAVPLYLAMAMSAGFGPTPAALFIVLDAVYRMEHGILRQLGQRIPLALGLLVSAGWSATSSLPPAVLYGVCPAAYLLAHWSLQEAKPATTREERLVERQVQLRIRPLEFGLAALSPLMAVGVQNSPWFMVAALPLLACTHLAAENVLLTASDETVAQVLEQLKGAQDQARRVSRQRDKALQEKQVLEGFSQQLAGQPSLEAVTTSLVATVGKLMSLDNAVIFLGDPPEPFSYRVSASHQNALQGAALTALREPLVDRAFQQKKPCLQKQAPSSKERLLRQDETAAALPLGGAGVLYIGRQKVQNFTPAELERLKWLAGKAAMALELAFKSHEEAHRRRRQEQTIHGLERQVAWLSRLVRGAEAMASSLQSDILKQRFTAAITQTVTHTGGQLLLEGSAGSRWGSPLEPHPELLKAAQENARPLVIEDTSQSRFGSPGEGVRSVVVSPLLARQECIGMLVLASDKPGAFTGEQMDLLFLLCSQAAMALSHAGLYSQVVEARRQLEESQASLVQSSKLTAIGQLAAGVAHELNSPLGAISLSVGEAINQLDERPELTRKFLNQAQVAVIRSKAIVDRLMAYSRKPQNELQSLSLQAVIRDTVDFLAFQLRSAGVDLELKLKEDALVEGEEQPLQQVITNLVLNAAQSMEDNTADRKTLTILLNATSESVVMEVKDLGSGIPQENFERIFDPFFTTKPVGRGTGLGLWACQQIVAQHQGTLTVTSKLEHGSTFTVSLPAFQPSHS